MTLAPELEELQAKRNAYIYELLDKCETDDDRFTTSRMFGVGGSDMPKLMGESKWGSAYKVWRDKTFRKTPEEIARDKDYLPFATGHALESVVADKYEKQTGYTVYEAESVAMKDYPFIVGNFDRLVYDKPIDEGGALLGGLECKTAERNGKVLLTDKDGNTYERTEWGKPSLYDGTILVRESDEINPEYWAQVQYYLMVSGLEWWDVGVLIGNNDLRFYRVHADREYHKKLFNAAYHFWTVNVLQDVAPAKSMSDLKAESLVKGKEGEATPEILEQLKQINKVKAEIKTLEAKQEELENSLCNEIADYTKMTYMTEDGKKKTAFTFKSSVRTAFNAKLFEAKNPTLYNQYVETNPTARSLRIYL